MGDDAGAHGTSHGSRKASEALTDDRRTSVPPPYVQPSGVGTLDALIAEGAPLECQLVEGAPADVPLEASILAPLGGVAGSK